jgi:hypothetical protein
MMSMKKHTKSSILFFAIGLLLQVSPLLAQKKKASETQERPNVIFILTDDQRWDALGYAGNEIIQTPEMDKLARRGCISKMHLSPRQFAPPAAPVFLAACMSAHINTPFRLARFGVNLWKMPIRGC